jgi:CRISPR-associated endonuclease Cas1
MIDWQLFLTADNFWQAWQKVRSNNGCAGVDGETIAAFERHETRNLEDVRRSLVKGTYYPMPLRALHIPKKSKPKLGERPKTEWRGLGVPTVRDRIVQQALLNLLHPILEPQFEESSFAYRPGRSYKGAVRQVDQWRKRGYDWVLDADLVKYFDNVQHSRLLAELDERVHDPAVGKLVDQWIRSGISTASGLILPEKGIPQGSGHLWSAVQFDLATQAAQFRRFEDVTFQFEMAQSLVKGKLWNLKQQLLKLRRQRDLPNVSDAIAGIDRDWQAVDQASSEVGLNVLRGYEGSAAARYFPALGQLITNPGFSLTGRSRRPPTDPTNSLLSFGYTLLFNNVMSLILVEGLNPYLGNLHRSERNDPQLAFDLMEEWRSPIVDSLVLKLINQKVLRPTDFTFPDQDGGVYLEEKGRRIFLKHFEERLSALMSHPDVGKQVSYRRAIQLQIQRYKRCLVNDLPYQPFRRVT